MSGVTASSASCGEVLDLLRWGSPEGVMPPASPYGDLSGVRPNGRPLVLR